jgi:hypothetical protein
MSETSATPTRHFADGVSLPDLVRHLREGVYILDVDGVVLDANPVAIDLFGFGSMPASVPRVVRDLARTPSEWRMELEALAASGGVREFMREFAQPNGSRRTVFDTCYARNDEGTVTYHGVLVDISAEQPRAGVSGEDAHVRDPWTGAFASEYLRTVEARLAEQPDAPMGLCVLVVAPPLTGQSPQAFDDCLERMTRFLLRHIRASEAVVRTAADQLAIVLPGANDRATEAVARRIQLAALRSAPSAFQLGWTARHDAEPLSVLIDRARHQVVPVRVVERTFDVPRTS